MTNPLDRFRKSAAAPAASGQAPAQPAPRGRSRYAGVKAADERYPMPNVGTYRVKIVETVETENQKSGIHFKAQLDIVTIFDGGDKHAPGHTVTMLQGVNPGKQFQVGGPMVKRFCLAGVGLDEEPPVNADGSDDFADLIEAAAGRFSETFSVNPLIGRLVDMQVVDGGPDGKGSFYRRYNFLPVPEAEQGGAPAA